jgi:hypothetical protein
VNNTTPFTFARDEGTELEVPGLDSGEVRRKLERDAIETEAMSPEQLSRFVAAEIAKWGPLAKAAIGGQSSGN